MKCIVGLGNPGSRYRETRHNVGFMFVEHLITAFGAQHLESTELYECYQTTIDEHSVMLLMPQTYMNNSGVAVRDFRLKYACGLEDMVIAYDDFQLPFGTLRFRPKGSDGGHNGLSSIIYQLQTDLIPRLRIGVGGTTLPADHTHELMAEYVLAPFDADEKKLLPELQKHVHDAIVSWMRSGIQKTMSQYNRNFFSSVNAE